MDTGHSFRRSVWAVLAVVGVAITSACSSGSTQKTTVTTVPVPPVFAPADFEAPNLDHAYWYYLWTRIPGSAARRCVRVKNRTDVRSHSFIVGNFRR
jgi:uncharacterized lipoprotein